jgi:NADPH-dependent 2,4-dienoyl-CoA reductase/sulfur reductase-like enzyme
MLFLILVMLMNIVVIGGGAAGASAAVRAKRVNPNANVVLIEATDMVTHGPCGIPYFIEGIVKDKNNLVTYTPEYLEKNRGVKVLVNTRAVDIDVDKKVIVVEKKGSQLKTIKFDKLVIATGAKPIIIGGTDRENVIALRHPAEVDKVKIVIDQAKKVAVIGGSYLGIEMAEALTAIGKRVILFEKEPQLMPKSLDPDIAKVIEDEMVSKGIELHLSEPVVELVGNKKVEKIVTTKSEYTVDAVVLAIGVKPNTDLARKAGVKLGVEDAIAVNEYMETSIEGIYAAGDAVEKFHKLLKKKVWIPLATSANKEGQVAGANAAGGRVLKFGGIVGTAVTKFYDLYIARTGLSEREARENNVKYRSTTIKVRTKAHYYPGSAEVVVKMIVDDNDVIVGFQAVGKDIAVAYYADIAAVSIDRRMSIEDLFFADLGYMPATAPVWHPLIVAARVLSRGKF